MVEVFKTNVLNREHADIIISEIKHVYPESMINFDLDDCDKILRIKSDADVIDSSAVIELLKYFGFDAQILPDDEQNEDKLMITKLHINQ